MAFDSLDISIGGESADAQTALQAVKSGLRGVKSEANDAGDSVEEAGDSVSGLTARLTGLTAVAGGSALSLAGLQSAVGGVASSLGSLAVSAGTVIPLLGAAAAAAAPLAATLGGIAVAGGAVGAVFGGGILAAAATETERLTTAFGEAKDGILEAIEPVGEAFADAIIPLIDRLPEVADSVVEAIGPLEPFTDAIQDAGNALLDAAPAIAAFAGDLAREALPVLRDLARTAAGVLPRAIRAMLDITRRVGPALLDVAGAIGDLIPPLTKAGMTILDVLIPAFESGIDVAADIYREFNDNQDVIQEFASVLKQAVNGNISGALSRFGDLTDDVFTDIRDILIGPSGDGGIVINGLRSLGSWLSTNGAALIKSAMRTLADAAINRIRNIRVVAVGESGNGGILNTLVDQAFAFLTGNATQLFRTGFESLEDAAIVTVKNLKTALVGESGSGGLLNNIIGDFSTFAKKQGPPLMRTAFEQLGEAIRFVAIDIYNAITGNEDSILRNIISDFVSYLKNDAAGDLKTAIGIAFDVLVAAAKGLYEGLVGNSTLKDIIRDFVTFLKDEAPSMLRSAAGAAFGAFTDKINSILGNLDFSPFKNALTDVSDAIEDLLGRVDELSNVEIDASVAPFDDIVDDIVDSAKDLFDPGSNGENGSDDGEGENEQKNEENEDGEPPPARDDPNDDEPPQRNTPSDRDAGAATGGFIESGGLARLHEGERVVPAAQISDRGPAPIKGGGVMIENLTVNASGPAEGRAAGRALKRELKRFDI